MGYDATAERLPRQTLFDLKGPRAALADWGGAALPPLPEAPNTRAEAQGVTAAHVGPAHWLLRAEAAAEEGLRAALRPDKAPPEISVLCISDTMAFFRIAGPQAAEVIATGCPLDLHPESFGELAASFTELYRVKALIARAPGGFDLGVEASFGPYIADCLALALR